MPVIVGVDEASEDDLKAVGAAMASSGAVAMFHMVGVTPEAPTLEDALQGREAAAVVTLDAGRMRTAYLGADDLERRRVRRGERRHAPHVGGRGTFTRCATRWSRRRDRRDVLRLDRARCLARPRRGGSHSEARSGRRSDRDRHVYLHHTHPGAARPHRPDEPAKWAYYAPGNLGLDVIFDSTEACVESAIAGTRVGGNDVWAD